MMRPAVLEVSAYYPPVLGGMEAVVELLAEELASRGWQVTVVTGREPGARRPDRRPTGANPQVLRHRSWDIGGLPVSPGMALSLLRHRRAIIHVHVSQALVPELSLVAAKLTGSQVVLHFHLDVEPSGPFGPIFSWYKRHILPQTLRLADRVVVLSESHERLMRQRYRVRADAIELVRNGVRDMAVARRDRRFDGPLQILFVGRLVRQKQVHVLLEALALMPADLRMATTIVGSGPLEADLRVRAEQLGLDRVRFTGRLGGDELAAAFRRADVYVLPSDGEGMPLALLEAMGAGLVPIGSDVPGIRDVIEDGVSGVLVPPGDASSLAEELCSLARDPTRASAIAHAAQSSVAGLTWSAAAARLTEIFTRLDAG